MTIHTATAERMSGAELQMIREYLGLTGSDLAEMLRVRADTVRAWETGRDPVSFRARDEIADIARTTRATVDELVTRLKKTDSTRTVEIYRRDHDFHTAHPEHDHMPARWWRHVAARVTEQLPDVTIVKHPLTRSADAHADGGDTCRG
ncbi:Aca2/YdiL-like domain-containing protein [Gordonia otitidis]|uniref:HTH cro/C1-type domain-containing protein n=1 Tax=Gordonia otitidis (strain DSM 44809 / CCUG 52243 / JCM 12355 / NBRC 100426 / IFM 10032) TaxID=1108044 RepID=H5TSN2_GORO1|nr:DUF1870 family protein [Gordonia otitidis]GAB36490.1 hypothetical protein GOOTI_221_00400 [Gordonia otitidis NBRC 100426]